MGANKCIFALCQRIICIKWWSPCKSLTPIPMSYLWNSSSSPCSAARTAAACCAQLSHRYNHACSEWCSWGDDFWFYGTSFGSGHVSRDSKLWLTQGLQSRRGEGKGKMGHPSGHNQMIAAELEQKWCSTFCTAPWSTRRALDFIPWKGPPGVFTHQHISQLPSFSPGFPTSLSTQPQCHPNKGDHPTTTKQLSQQRFFFLPPELKAQPLGMGPARLLPSLHPHWLPFLQGPLSGSSPLMFSVSFQNNQPAALLMSSETSEQWVKSASKQNVVQITDSICFGSEQLQLIRGNPRASTGGEGISESIYGAGTGRSQTCS